MGTTLRMAEPLVDPLDHVVAEALADLVGVHVRLGGRVTHEVRQQPLDEPVAADDALRPLAPARGQDRLLALASFDEPLALEPLQHLAGRGARDAQHLGHAGGERGGAGGLRPVFADREGEEVDSLQILVDRMPRSHGPSVCTPPVR